jgi:hypothetical protein
MAYKLAEECQRSARASLTWCERYCHVQAAGMCAQFRKVSGGEDAV